MKMKRLVTVTLAVTAFSTAAMLRPGAGIARAHDAPEGRISVSTSTTEAALRGRPVMLSAVQGSSVVNQTEARLSEHGTVAHLPAGLYDLRVEGDGLRTLVKRGIHVYGGRDTAALAPLV